MSDEHTGRYYISGTSRFVSSNIEKIKDNLDDFEDMSFNGEELDKGEFFNFTNSMSMFHDCKLAVVSNVSKIKPLEEFIASTTSCIESVIILHDIKDEKPGVSKTLQKHLDAAEYEILSEGKLRKQEVVSQIGAVFRDKGFKVSSKFCYEVFEIFAGNLTEIENEAEKLSLYFQHKRPEHEGELLAAVSTAKQNTIFNLTDAFAMRRRKEAQRLLHNVLEQNIQPKVLFYMLFDKLEMITKYRINPKLITAHPYVIQKLGESAGKWNDADIERIAELFSDADYHLKTGQSTMHHALTMILSSI